MDARGKFGEHEKMHKSSSRRSRGQRKALLVSVTGDSHDVLVGNSSIRPQSYCRRPETVGMR